MLTYLFHSLGLVMISAVSSASSLNSSMQRLATTVKTGDPIAAPPTQREVSSIAEVSEHFRERCGSFLPISLADDRDYFTYRNIGEEGRDIKTHAHLARLRSLVCPARGDVMCSDS